MFLCFSFLKIMMIMMMMMMVVTTTIMMMMDACELSECGC